MFEMEGSGRPGGLKGNRSDVRDVCKGIDRTSVRFVRKEIGRPWGLKGKTADVRDVLK